MQTCAFDSIFQVIVSGLLANRVYYENLQSSDCPIINLAQNVSNKKKITKENYVQRAKILLTTFIFQNNVTTYTRNIKRLVAECNAHLAQFLFEKEPSYSYRVECFCGYVNSRKSQLMDVNVDMILCSGLHLIQEAIDDCMITEKTCFNCKKKIASLTEYGVHLIIDTFIVTDINYPNRDNKISHKLSSLKKTVKVGGKTYMLIGVVDYSIEKKHCAAYALAGEFWYKYDGLIKKRETVNSKTIIYPHLIAYAICDTE